VCVCVEELTLGTYPGAHALRHFGATVAVLWYQQWVTMGVVVVVVVVVMLCVWGRGIKRAARRCTRAGNMGLPQGLHSRSVPAVSESIAPDGVPRTAPQSDT